MKGGIVSSFDRSGLAALSDLETNEWRKTIKHLEAEQTVFLAHESEFRTTEYRWPVDALRNWSRVWEYPYAFNHLTEFSGGRPVHIADIGSGVTFFPFALSRAGLSVTCTDLDEVCGRELTRAASVVPHAPGRVAFRHTNGMSLPFRDGEVDGATCISVLEHVPEHLKMVGEMARIIRPKGILVLTMDLDLTGDHQLGVSDHKNLIPELQRFFSLAVPDMTIHPLDQLRSHLGPYPELGLRGTQFLKYLAREPVRRMLGRAPASHVPFRLAVQGMVLIRK
jgi:2-polyprenyl-3-methyl-5-hydroxy-6-metoxy-1,4-benzoquinol methylase